VIWVEVLVEGKSDEPVVHEIFTRKLGLQQSVDYRVHAHGGKGTLPSDLLRRPDPKNRTLLHQLPAKLRAYGKSLALGSLIVVLIDADNAEPSKLLAELEQVKAKLAPIYPRVLFCLAVEETESWFIADHDAVKRGFPHADLQKLRGIKPDAIVGAWERLGEALQTSGTTGADKLNWATRVSPHLNLDKPKSPSLAKVIEQLRTALKRGAR
jgi:Domain of unknown function (DUF4276)